MSYVQKCFHKRIDNSPRLDEAFVQAAEQLQGIASLSSLDWYFKKFHEPPDLFQHNGRVTFSLLILSNFYSLLSGKELENLVISSLIHQLEGETALIEQSVASQQTIASLEKAKCPVEKEVLKLIDLHDELCSGKGFPHQKKMDEIPSAVRIFTLCNHFDHYRLTCKGTRRARYERTKQLMTERELDYDPSLWKLFWNFWEESVEAIT